MDKELRELITEAGELLILAYQSRVDNEIDSEILALYIDEFIDQIISKIQRYYAELTDKPEVHNPYEAYKSDEDWTDWNSFEAGKDAMWKAVQPYIEARVKEERENTAEEILGDIEKHCLEYQWRPDFDTTKWHYPYCPTDLKALKEKYLGSPLKGK